VNTLYILDGVKQHSWRKNFMYYSAFLHCIKLVYIMCWILHEHWL